MYPAATFPSTFSRRTPRNLAAHIDPGHALIGVKSVVDDVLQHVATHISSTMRVSPVEIAATSRSGKSTVLFSVYQALAKGINEPVLISFNGDSGFKIRDGEPPLDAFCRAFHEQLTGHNNCAAPTPDELLLYLASCDKPLVVLLDELNEITPEGGDEKLAEFVRDELLDKAGRYLVFTCHYPMDVQVALGSRGASSSLRGQINVGVPMSVNIDDYSTLHEVRRLNPVEIALWGGLCGLVWTLSSRDVSSSRNFKKFVGSLVDCDHPSQEHTQRAFFDQILNGSLSDKMSRYLRFAYFPDDKGTPIWPLCYISDFLDAAGHTFLSRFVEVIVGECGGLEQTNGMEWQALVLGAIAIRISSAQFFPLQGIPKRVIGKVQQGAEFFMVHLPHSVQDVIAAEKYLQSNHIQDAPLTILGYATHPSFKIFDGIIIHFDGKEITRRCGLQSKQGRAGVKDAPPDRYEGILLRGSAPGASKDRTDGWLYLDEKDVLELLPSSFRPLYPRNWPH